MDVTGNEQRALLTPEFVAKHSIEIEYDKDSIEPGNEGLAQIASLYGYSQQGFEHMQIIFNQAKAIKDKSVIKADVASGKNGITFRVLEKDDPLGFVIGNLTNCCQRIGDAAESCVIDGYVNPNAGFMVFERPELDEYGNPTGEVEILGQAYVWYDPITKTVCYDNIEVPTIVLHRLKKGDKHDRAVSLQSFLDVVEESAQAVVNAMRNNGVEVNRVTTGQQYNDLEEGLRQRFGNPEIFHKAKHRGYTGYSDAKKAQYVIGEYDKATKKYAKNIRKVAEEIQSDLQEIIDNENQNTQGFGGV
jgi:hypothetical protein